MALLNLCGFGAQLRRFWMLWGGGICTEQIEQHKQHMRELHGTPVIQCTRDGEPVKIWQSISEAGEALNIDTGNIAHSARKERDTAGGYIWVYVDDYLFDDALISAVIGE